MAFKRGLAALFVLVGLVFLAPSVSAAVEIHAHRGGANVEGEAMFGENSMAAFRHSAEAGFVIELDLARTSDGVAVAMHDDTLDRTTNCEGNVADYSWAGLSVCQIDRIGIGDVRQNLNPGDPRLEPVPRLSQIIGLLKETGTKANIEVKNITSNDQEFPDAVYAELAASGLPSSQVILQNFKSGKLKSAATIYPGVSTSQLCVNLIPELDQLTIEGAVKNGVSWLSPEWPVSETLLSGARDAGLLLAPWTIDDPAQMVAAAESGADAVITNDPTMAYRLIGKYTKPVPEPEPELASKLELKLIRGKVRARPGGKILFKARITNSGDAASGTLRLNTLAAAGPFRFAGKWPRTVSPIAPGQSKMVRLKLKVKPGARKTGSFRVFFQLAEAGGKPMKRSLKVWVLRPRR